MKAKVSTVSTKGQLVIPSKLRRKYSIKEGTQVARKALFATSGKDFAHVKKKLDILWTM
jgi:hypothetical protein